MSSEFKQQLKIQMHAREVSSFDSWSRYLKFVTAVQRAVHSESDSSLDDAIKDGKKKIRSLKNIPVGERKTPKDLFPNSLLTKDSEWPEDKGDCVFDFNNVQCPYGDKCFRNHAKNPKSSPSSAATNGSISPKCERSRHRCAGCLRRRSDCSWRRRSPASSAAAVKMMIRTRHLHCLRIVFHRAPAARARRIERNSTWLSST